MRHNAASIARLFFLALAFVSAFFLCCTSASAQEKPKSGDKIKDLKEKRLALLIKIREGVEKLDSRYREGATLDRLLQLEADVLAARLDLAETKEHRINVYLETILDAEKREMRMNKLFLKADIESRLTQIDIDRVRAFVLEVQIALEKANAAK